MKDSDGSKKAFKNSPKKAKMGGVGDRQGQGHRMGWPGVWRLLKPIIYDI